MQKASAVFIAVLMIYMLCVLSCAVLVAHLTAAP
jgi:hypothetical protein